ncbi:hypothetical protein ACLOJK_029562 [Asimina triloba]
MQNSSSTGTSGETILKERVEELPDGGCPPGTVPIQRIQNVEELLRMRGQCELKRAGSRAMFEKMRQRKLSKTRKIDTATTVESNEV